MILAAGVALALASRCAPAVAPRTLLALVAAESGFDTWAIHVNGPVSRVLHPRSQAEAEKTANSLLAQGADIDIGLTQINRRNLDRVGLSGPSALDACANLAGGARILQDAYEQVHRSEPDPQNALRAALSIYNTGDPKRGRRNGYVGRVSAIAMRGSLPALIGNAAEPVAPRSPVHLEVSAPIATRERLHAPQARSLSLDVFADGRSPTLVWGARPFPGLQLSVTAAQPFSSSSSGDVS